MARRRTRRRRGGSIEINAAKSMTKAATTAISKGVSDVKSAEKMCGHIKNMFLKNDCKKRVEKAANAAKKKLEDAKAKMEAAKKKLTGVKAKADAIQKKIDSGSTGAVSPQAAGGRSRRRRTKRRRRSRSRSRGRKSRRRRRRRSRRRRR